MTVFCDIESKKTFLTNNSIIIHSCYLALYPTNALMCRSTGTSLGGTMGTLSVFAKLAALGWLTLLYTLQML